MRKLPNMESSFQWIALQPDGQKAQSPIKSNRMVELNRAPLPCKRFIVLVLAPLEIERLHIRHATHDES